MIRPRNTDPVEIEQRQTEERIETLRQSPRERLRAPLAEAGRSCDFVHLRGVVCQPAYDFTAARNGCGERVAGLIGECKWIHQCGGQHDRLTILRSDRRLA